MTAGEFVSLSYRLAVVVVLQTDLLRFLGFLVLDCSDHSYFFILLFLSSFLNLRSWTMQL